ncbi:MAG: alpha-galactosidase [Clostridia bacterium]|nr:alpha-galactosidase [Clostridia bacterium]
MSIVYKNGVFTLQTANSTYQMKISEHGHLLHLYYGNRISDDDVSYLIPQVVRSHESNPAEAGEDRVYSLCAYPQEFSSNDAGDYRVPSIELINPDGSYAFVGKYQSHTIYHGKYCLSTLPTLFAGENDNADTLEIVLEDLITNVSVKLLYGVFFDQDVITRSAILYNGSEGELRLQRLMSASLDFMTGDYDMIEFFGHHYLERQTNRHPLTHGINEIGSFRGASGHFHNPFAILCDRNTDEDHGNAYGFCLMYSGNFVFEAEVDGYSQTRVAMGIHPKQFEFRLAKGESFEAPEVVMAYSSKGLSALSHRYHDIFRENACKSKFVHGDRPILINSWEPFYFHFDSEKLLQTAKSAKAFGVDMLVLDDGWFGTRNDGTSGLGDWVANEQKLPGGIPALAEKIHQMGMKFGLWFEPEMVNEDSDLYRTHPDWVLRVPNRAPSRSRHQLCLDLSRPDVCEYIINAVNAVLDKGGVDYVKWDYNRYVCDVYSQYYAADRQGEIYHRYILGLYNILDGIVKTHPHILFEGCSGGGGRFDGAMLTYFPQIWCSDNTDAPSRLTIQYGTSFAYPVCTMGAHVSACPAKKTQRTVPFKTRAITAMHGTFGYELDPTKMSENEIAECAEYTAFYQKHRDLIAYGNYYRLSSPYDDQIFTAWQFVSKDKKESLVCAVTQDISILDRNCYIHLRGLEPDCLYSIQQTGQTLSSAALQNIGILLPHTQPQYNAFAFEIKKIEHKNNISSNTNEK